jgi:hypothetical protein
LPKIQNIQIKILKQGIQAANFHVTVFNTSISNLPANIFRNLGHNVRNISLHFHENNKLTNIPNPNTAQFPQTHDKTFLTSLKWSGETLNCDCEVG